MEGGEDDAAVVAARGLPFESRVASSNWRVRVEAYADALKEAAGPPVAAADSALLRDFGAATPKVAADGNANALDSGLEAINAFLACAAATDAWAAGAAPALSAALVSKGLTARAKTAGRASEALLLLVQLDTADVVCDALFKGLQGKLPKGVAACADVLLSALRAFGPRVVKPSPLLKACGPLFDHKDGSVRDNAKEIAARFCARCVTILNPLRRWS